MLFYTNQNKNVKANETNYNEEHLYIYKNTIKNTIYIYMYKTQFCAPFTTVYSNCPGPNVFLPQVLLQPSKTLSNVYHNKIIH